MQSIKKIMAFITACTSMITLSGMYESATPVALEAESVLVKETINFYDYWKEKYLVQNPYVTDETQYYVFYGDQTYSEAGYEVEVTVSEAHGYGMLIAASMSDYDNEAKKIFDGMYRYYQSHLSEIGPNLMAWQQNDNGKAIVNSSSGADSATDGDMDIAYALLMADSIWGSDGEINYKQSAVDVINDIMTYEVNKTDWVLQLGDWVYGSSENDTYYAATRSSDFIMQYMPVFAEATGDERWLKLYENTYNIINKIVDKYGTGILPDFIIKDSATGEFIPAPANLLESENDGNYYYNACRTPWRISMDYLINGNEDALKFANAINNFIISKTGGDPWNIMAGYAPDGTTISDWNDLCFDAPFLISAACGDNMNWHDSVRDMILNYGEDVYFGDTITMLCLIVDDGCWIVPESINMSIPGDVNADGTFNISDVVMMQKWLLAVPDVKLEDWKAGDLCNDNILNVFDLCLMKRELIRTTVTTYIKPDHEVLYGSPIGVEAEEISMYLGPDTSYSVVETIPQGTILNELGVQENNNNWVFVEYEGQYGWIQMISNDGETLCKILDLPVADKPVIYLYPEKETDVHVELELTEADLSTTYPKYNNGWDVVAYPDGTLLNKADGTHHKYLFWDAVNCRTRFDFSKGFCVAGSDTESFLKEKLTYMGLTEQEMNEFIVYWLPLMEHNAYNLISFQGEAYTNSAKLNITPTPDSMLRIFMAYVPLDNAVDIEPQQLETFERNGFTVVEWGGTEIKTGIN